jgi:hypothetical protein
MTNIEIRPVKPKDSGISEEWVRVTDVGDILGVGATRSSSCEQLWQVWIAVAEFIRSEPLQSELQVAITNALNEIPGVTEATQVDREVWEVQGDVSARSLIVASAIALDSLAEALRAAYAALHSS